MSAPVVSVTRSTADPRRPLGVFDVEGGVGGEPPLPAVGAPVIGAEHFGGTQHGEDGFQPHVLKPSLTSAGTGHACLDWSRLTEEFGQTRCSGGMQRGAQRQLHCFDVPLTRLAPFGEDTGQQRVYFARDFLMDRSSRFFSSALHFSAGFSTGRRRQILSLMFTNSAHRCCQRWYS